jgi:hypothetical protein
VSSELRFGVMEERGWWRRGDGDGRSREVVVERAMAVAPYVKLGFQGVGVTTAGILR